MAVADRFTPNLVVRLKGKNVSPEMVPFHVISKIVAAVQSIIAGQEQDETEGTIRLLKLRRGSVGLDCYYPHAELQSQHVQDVRHSIDDATFAAGDIGFAINPLQALSAAAKRLDMTIEVAVPKAKAVLMKIDAGTYERFSTARFISGATTVVGELVRVGGRTDRCVIQPAGDAKLLYCSVKEGHEGDELLKRLSRHLRETVVLRGQAVWVRGSWSLREFTVNDIVEQVEISTEDHVKQLQKLGGRRWTALKNPKEHLANVLRGS